MSWARLVWRNLWYYWRGNLAVLLGMALGTAIFTGALVVGDSLRGSLRDRVLGQLGWVDQALVAGRFFRAELANSLGAEHAAPVIFIQGAANLEAAGNKTRATRINLLAVDERFWRGEFPEVERAFWSGAADEVVLNQALADELGARAGDTITLHLQKVSLVPRETLLGRRGSGDVVDELKLKVRAVLPDTGMARFGLRPDTATARNAFLPLQLLQDKLKQPGRVNGLLVAGAPANLQQNLRTHLTLTDWGLFLVDPESRTTELFKNLDRNKNGKLERREWQRRVAESLVLGADRNRDGILDRQEVLDYFRKNHNYLSLESRQMLLEPAVVDAVPDAARQAGLRTAPTLVYLANTIAVGSEQIPYSVVAALDPSQAAPLGPFLPPGVSELKDGQIVLVQWDQDPWTGTQGQNVALTYFPPVHEGKLAEATSTLKLAGFIPLAGAAADPDITPEFPGITDKLSLRDWDPPFPYDNKRVGDTEEQFWEEYRTTPRAYVTLAEGQRLWGSRFGNLTSVRMAAPNPAEDLAPYKDKFQQQLLSELRPEQGGFVFDAVRANGLLGSAGAQDFGLLLTGFSMFLILSALLLVGLLCRLNLERRSRELGILIASGYPQKTIRRLLLAENLVLAVVGGIVGLAAARLFTWGMLELLARLWPGGSLSFLRLHTSFSSLLIGYVGTLLVSLLTIVWAVRFLSRSTPCSLLAGQVNEGADKYAPANRRRGVYIAAGCFVLALVLAVAGFFFHDHEARASTFLGSGMLVLIAGLVGLRGWMRGDRRGTIASGASVPIVRLGFRNVSRYPVRSLLTIGLLAAATFLIVALEAFHREPGAEVEDKNSGSGGFLLLGESDVPIYQDLNSPEGQSDLRLSPAEREALAGIKIYSCRLRSGDDVSCLNLYQPNRPRVLGVPAGLIKQDGFQFQATDAKDPDSRENPWILLERDPEGWLESRSPRSDNPISAFVDATTAEYVLHKKLGDTIEVPDEQGKLVSLQIVGLLKESIFQGEVLISEKNFTRLYPRQEGYLFFLIDAPKDRVIAVKRALENGLEDHGFAATTTADRLASFYAVENTYLATFQALGALGLILGALGLAVVLLRSVWERRAELALLRALGYRNQVLGRMVLAENSLLLFLGLCLGVIAALVAVTPQHYLEGGEASWSRLALFLLAVIVVGLVSGALAVRESLRAPLLTALRRE